MQQKYQTSRSTPKLNVLFAFPYFNKRVAAGLAYLGDDVRFLLDSGAFTAFKAGKPIALDDYCQFLSTIPVRPWRYFTLDVIGDADATLKNYEAMRERGFTPIPIFTRGAPIEHLDRYFATSDLVGLGGVAGKDPGAYRWLKYVMQHAAGRRVHVLGFSSMEWVKYFKPYSMDSSSWKSARMYGRIPIYLGRGQITNLSQHDLLNGMPEDVAQAVRRGGFDPYDLKNPVNWGGTTKGLGNWIGASQFIRLCSEMETRLGTLYFLAAEPGNVGGMIAAFRSVTNGTLWTDEMDIVRQHGLAA